MLRDVSTAERTSEYTIDGEASFKLSYDFARR